MNKNSLHNNDHSTFRAFFALDIPQETKEQITIITTKLKKSDLYPSVKWTKIENLHITMRFLGNISYTQYDSITKLVNEAIHNFSPFTLQFSRLIIFPNIYRPVAIALKPEPISILILLNQILEKALPNCEIHNEIHPFSPHLTLGKFKNQLVAPLPKWDVSNIICPSQHLALFRSETGKEDSNYTKLACFML